MDRLTIFKNSAKKTDLITGNMSNYAWIGCKNMTFFDIMHPVLSQFGAFNTPLLEFSYGKSNEWAIRPLQFEQLTVPNFDGYQTVC